MTKEQWAAFVAVRDTFKSECSLWTSKALSYGIATLQVAAAAADSVPPYSLDNSVVYPLIFDSYTQESEVKLIVVGDNPGKDEQLMRNQNYLVGQAGKLGAGFFAKHPELGVDFRRNVLLLNKTPIHTAKTKELQYLVKHAGVHAHDIKQLIADSVSAMALHAVTLMKIFNCPLWLVGYGELRTGAFFAEFGSLLKDHLSPPQYNDVLVFQHFSMNRFSIDLQAHYDDARSLADNLLSLGVLHRQEILHW